MSTHKAIALEEPSVPLTVITLPTPTLSATQILVRTSLVSMTPLSAHQIDHNLLTAPFPFIPGGNLVGTVVARGSDSIRPELHIGAKVFSYSFGPREGKACQELVVVEQSRAAVIPMGVTDLEAVAVPDSFVSAWHSLNVDLGIPLAGSSDPTTAVPQPPANAHKPVLIWGGATSVGRFALQILHRHGFTDITTTASLRHFDELLALGASRVFDYADPNVSSKIGMPQLVLDCIGDEARTLPFYSTVVAHHATVAVLLPVRMRDGSISVTVPTEFASGVTVRPVHAQRYEKYPGAEDLQPSIMPRWLKEGWIKACRTRWLRATGAAGVEEALHEFRAGTVKNEKLVMKMVLGGACAENAPAR
ncbi:hypothetical protein HDU87_006364 [Geranomyces variabilis]|uniref:Enoyl reductase (ER) domain-containing protein n=1 Tax=Geranomyces variabilis TaxID=109894 RepID=A0AAD5THY1_9FUNG|nr:hypothetical protein HDU87_006364 [Geranomyces variabilis]